MSIPISRCLVSKAYDDNVMLKRLSEAIAYNMKQGSMLCLPCTCDPPCRELTDSEANDLIIKMEGLEEASASEL